MSKWRSHWAIDLLQKDCAVRDSLVFYEPKQWAFKLFVTNPLYYAYELLGANISCAGIYHRYPHGILGIILISRDGSRTAYRCMRNSALPPSWMRVSLYEFYTP